MQKTLNVLTTLSLALFLIAAAPADRHVRATLQSANGSTVSGTVNLVGLPQGGTMITVHATGLTPGAGYLSIYYENHTCELEPDSVPNDVIARYVGGAGGSATVHAKIDDDLDEVNSISVRLADSALTLQACADVHP